MVQLLLIACLAVLLLWLFNQSKKPSNFPPGPPRLPILGSLPFMTSSGEQPSLLRGVTEMVKKYGPVVGFYFCSTPAIIIADGNILKEAFKHDELAARPDLRPSQYVRPGYEVMNPQVNGIIPGVIFSHGGYWRELRRFMLRNLRDFGFGKSSMEDLFQVEVTKLCQVLSKHCDQPISLEGTMSISIVNALWSILVGEKLELEDPNLERVVTLVNNLMRGNSPMSILAAILPHPDMATWPVINKFSGYNKARKTYGALFNVIGPYVEEHEQTLDPENIRDFLDLMLIEQKKTTDPTSCFYGKVGHITASNALIDLFMAGMETTSTSLVSIFLQLLHHPEVQIKVHQEIDEVIGKARLPRLEDKENMPFTNAVIQESMRITSLVHLGVPHSCLEEVKVAGYTFPKGTTVIGALYLAMRDPKVFPDPEVFKPERFINESGEFVHNDHVIPFGIGKRYCLGQSLAEKEFFMFFTGIMQQFEMQHSKDEELPSYVDIWPAEALIRPPPPYKVILRKRY